MSTPNLNKPLHTAEENFRSFREGLAEIVVPEENNVFYNPVQEFNRDMSIAALSALAEEHKNCDAQETTIANDASNLKKISYKNSESVFTVLEALSASGLRSIRYAKEIPGIKKVIANDISESAVKSIKNNVLLNNVESVVNASHSDAVMLMYAYRHPSKRVQAVDLDPYGCPTQFLDSAVQCVADGGLLLVTCTDMAVLAGNSPETCHAKYGAVSLRNKACHEMALRIVIQCIETHANRYGRYIVPVLSLSADFYVRVFVKVYSGAAVCKRSLSKLSLVYQCVGCETYILQPLGAAHKYGEKSTQYKFSLPHAPSSGICEHCGHKFHIGGPIWNGSIHDEAFVSKMKDIAIHGTFGTARRMEGMLTVIQEELPDIPLYYSLDRLCSTIRSETMSMLQFRSALLNSGYRVSLSHAFKKSIKTDAPASFVWDVVRTWQQSHPVKAERLTNVGRAILSIPPSGTVSFDIHPSANPNSRQMGLVRYQENPRPYWGPGSRAKTNLQDEERMLKSFQNQGKRGRSNSGSPDKAGEKNKRLNILDKLSNEEPKTL